MSQTGYPPKITVVMPVYNAAVYLREALDSILSQTFSDFELLILDGGSTDNTVSLIQSYSDLRIRLICTEPGIGLAKTLNLGIDQARGDYIARMDADDIANPTRLEKQLAFMETHPAIQLLGTAIIRFGPKRISLRHEFPTTHEEIRAELLFTCPISHASVLLRRTFLDQHHLRYSTAHKRAEDYELWTRLISCGQVANLKDTLMRIRFHPAQVSTTQSDTHLEDAKRIQQQLLKELSPLFTAEEMALHTTITFGEFKPSIGFLEQSLNWFQKLHQVNQDTSYFVPEALEKRLLFRWLILCLKHRNLGMRTWVFYKNSDLGKAYLKTHPWMSPALFLLGLVYSLRAIFAKPALPEEGNRIA